MTGPAPLRVIFDENASADVAHALNLLDKDVVRTKPAKPGKKGIPDDEVARRAQRQNRLVFTSNYDMVMAAIDAGVRVIWFYDAKKGSPTKFDTARLWFRKWEDWERTLTEHPDRSLRISMARSTPITAEAAYRQARRLDRKVKRRRTAIAQARNQLRLDLE